MLTLAVTLVVDEQDIAARFLSDCLERPEKATHLVVVVLLDIGWLQTRK